MSPPGPARVRGRIERGGAPRSPRRSAWPCLPALGVVALAVDAAALAILHMLDAGALAGAEPAAVGAAARLIGGNAALLALQPIGFARIQLAACHAMGDALLLVR